MKVYQLTYGEYSDRYTVGIYAERHQAEGKIALDALEGRGPQQAEINEHFVFGLDDD